LATFTGTCRAKIHSSRRHQIGRSLKARRKRPLKEDRQDWCFWQASVLMLKERKAIMTGTTRKALEVKGSCRMGRGRWSAKEVFRRKQERRRNWEILEESRAVGKERRSSRTMRTEKGNQPLSDRRRLAVQQQRSRLQMEKKGDPRRRKKSANDVNAVKR